jgi:N12 class adenine-specific DNA methylase/adenine-specific DNA methylase
MANNYRITEEFPLGQGGAKTKARNNLAAIELLKRLESEGRQADLSEQQQLAQYVGWGGIPQVFNPTPDPDWKNLAEQVKTTLEPDEYNAAFESVLNAHYTSYDVIREIYQGLDHLGFTGGRILEPAMGVGNFLGLMPAEIERRSEVTGIELDSITGRIAQQLYPEHQIYVQGFEKARLPKDSFDLTLSNVPFGDYKISDPEYNDLNLKVHNYFLARSLDRVRPGGIVCVITSTGTMQSKSNKGFRVWIAERANLVGAMRLPGDAFKTNAGTEVTTDLIVLQKLGPTVQPSNEPWIDVVDIGIKDAEGNELTTNEYYARHSERMLGIPCDDKLHPGRLALQGQGNTIERMRETFIQFPSNIYQERERSSEVPDIVRVEVPPDSQIKNYGFLAQGEQLWQRRDDYLYPSELKGRTAERVLGMLEIRDAVNQVFEVQIRGGTDAELAQSQQKLNQIYDKFVRKQGYLSNTANSRPFNVDPDSQLLLALEKENDITKTFEKADVFTRRTVRPRIIKDQAETAQEALITSLNEYGRVVPGYMAQLLSQPEAEVINELREQKLIYREPTTAQWQTQDEYLSGEVREKLKQAQVAAEGDGQYQANVAALEAVQPRDLGPGEVEVRLGAPWLPTETIAEFASHLLELNPADKLIKVEHSSKLAMWSVTASYQTANNALNTSTYGTPRLTALELIEVTLNLKDAVVHVKDADGNLKLDQEATLASRMKQQQVQDKFKNWIWQDFERSEKLCRIYNDLFNGKVIREFRNPNLEMPGSSPNVELRPHQKDAVWRTLQSDSTLLAHVVGAGKTYTMIGGAIEMRRLGIAQKPMIVVPNHMLGQFTRELYELYPNAKVLAPSEKDTQASKRRELMARIATGDWDAVVVTHSAFTRLPVSEAQKLKFHKTQLDELDNLMGDIDTKQGNAIVKQLARERKKLKERVDRITQSKIKDNGVTFEQLGVDALFVDEAHFWKNLGRSSKLQNIAGLSNTSSQRAEDAFMKCRIVQDDGGKIVFATGTPVSNSIAELYTMQRFLQPQALERQGIENFDAWVGAFAEKVTAAEIDPTGRFKMKNRLTRFTNVPELMTLFREVGDIKTAAQLDLPTPQVERLTIATSASPLQVQYMERLIERAELVAARRVEPDQDNMLWITTDGRRASLDPRLISESFPDFPESKVNQSIANIEAIWKATEGERSTQMVFCDLGTPKKGKGDAAPAFSIYQHIKDGLIARGVPAEEIAFIHDAPKSKDKENLYAAVREGKIRVLIGSTEKCGVGMNVQERLIAEHHIDPPWRPSDIEQREGRILRQGNRNPKVLILTYVTQGRDGQLGFDSYSWQTLARKAQMVGQVMNGDSTIRSVDDVSSTALSFDEIKAIATGNPLIIEKATVDNRVTELLRYKQSFLSERYSIQRTISNFLPEQISRYTKQIQQYTEDIERKIDTRGDLFGIKIGAREFAKREEAGQLLQGILSKVALEQRQGSQKIGEFAGFNLIVGNSWNNHPFLQLKSPNGMTYDVNGGESAIGLVRSLEHSISKIDEELERSRSGLARSETDLVTLTKNLDTAFEYDSELETLLVRQQEINGELGINKSDEQALATAEQAEETEEASPPQAEQEPEGDAEKTEEAEGETLVNLDELVSADAAWSWDASVTWDTDTLCAPSAELIDALERLNLEKEQTAIATALETPEMIAAEEARSALTEAIGTGTDPPVADLADSVPDSLQSVEPSTLEIETQTDVVVERTLELQTQVEAEEVATAQVIVWDSESPSTPAIEPQQLSLLGQLNVPRPEPTQRQSKSGGDRSRSETTQRAPAAPRASIGGDTDVSAARSRLTGFTPTLGTLGKSFEQSVEPTARNRESNRADVGVQSNTSVGSGSTTDINHADRAARNISETGVSPSTERNTEVNSTAQPSPSMVERDTVEPQNTTDIVPSLSPQREPRQFVADSDGPQQEIHAHTGANERAIEQPRNSTQEAQTSQLETIAGQWTDAQLLDHQKNVQAYFEKAVPEPDWSEQPKLIAEVKLHASECLKLSKEVKDHKQNFEKLGEPRSILHPFGSPKSIVNDARNQYLTSRLKYDESEHQQKAAQAKLTKWQRSARDYREWRHGPEGKTMHELKPIFELKSTQERLTQIQANEKRKEGLDVLNAWEKVAIALGRSSDYVGRIREISVEYSQGGSVSEKAIAAMCNDNQALQQRQEQQIQLQPRRGFSR